MNPTTVLFKWDVRKELKDYLTEGLCQIKNLKLIFPDDVSEANLVQLISNADILVGWRPSEKLFQNAHQLKLHINPGVGVQHLLPKFEDFYQQNHITLVNGHGNTYFTAQHAVALLLTLMNKVIPHHQWMVEGKWRTGDAEARTLPLRYRTVGFLGYGHVNQKVHQFLAGFNVNFAALKTSWSKSVIQFPTPLKKYTSNQLDAFLKDIDIVIIAVPQTDATTNLLTISQLEKLGEDGLLINIARGPVVNEEDLYNSLKDHTIRGAAIDVWYDYTPDPDSEGKKYPYHYKFHNLNNIILSPHRGASPFDDLERWDEVIENIKRFAAGRTDFLNIVDLKSRY